MADRIAVRPGKRAFRCLLCDPPTYGPDVDTTEQLDAAWARHYLTHSSTGKGH